MPSHSPSPAPSASTPGPSSNAAATAGASGKRKRERTPEADEDLSMERSATNMWLVRMPRYVRKAWSAVEEPDKLLGYVRVYDPDHRSQQRMQLILPDAPAPAAPYPSGYEEPEEFKQMPRRYDLRIVPTEGHDPTGGVGASRNTYAFEEEEVLQERDDDDDSDAGDSDFGEDDSRKKRRTHLIGGVTNEVICQAPVQTTSGGRNSEPTVGLTEESRAMVRYRTKEAAKPRAQVKLLDENDAAVNNRLAAGVSAAGFVRGPQRAGLIPAKQKVTTEKFARLPQNELLDLLMTAFDSYPYWSMKGLRGHTQQPESYLREVLSSIADLHKRGPYNGNWSLKKDYAAARNDQKVAQGPAGSSTGPGTNAGAGGSGPSGQQQQSNGTAGAAAGEEDEDLEEVV